MAISKDVYVPILKWRMGEYQALFRLDSEVKDSIVPLLVIPPIEYDFEEQRPKKTIQEHMSPFGTRYKKKWGGRKALIDLDDSLEDQVMPSGKTVIQFIFDTIRSEGGNARPVVRFSNGENYKKSINEICQKDEKGAAFRVKLEELMDVSFNENAIKLLKEIGCEKESVDLILDLDVPETFEPYEEFSEALKAAISGIDRLDSFRSFVISGTSLYLEKIKKPGGELHRHEWDLYKHLCTCFENEVRIPSFSDYTIERPGFVDLDMRQIKPAGKIIYTTTDLWYVCKGGAFRDNNSQMKVHCEAIVNSAYFKGENFSEGDLRIMNTANGRDNYGNLTTWKWVGVNHHVTTVVEQLANFHD